MYIYEIGCMSHHFRQGEPDKALKWRDDVDRFVVGLGKTFNPSKAYNPSTLHLNSLGRISVDQNEYYIEKCDMAICNLADIDHSPGSIYELTRFKMEGKPVIAFGTPNWSPHIMSCCSCVVPTLGDALDLMATMFV